MAYPQTETSPKAVAVLPGFMGSKLYAAADIYNKKGRLQFKRNERLWIYSPLMDGCFQINWQPDKSLLPTIDNRFEEDDRILTLACDAAGKPVHPLMTAGVDEREAGDYGASGQYGTVGTYTALMTRLKAAFADSARFLNYDWRVGVRAAVNEMRPALDALAAAHDELCIVAHSMGGLAALVYISESPRPEKLRLITLGTPFYGAPETLYIMKTGKSFPLDFGAKALAKIAPNILSGYELLPTPAYGPYITNAQADAVLRAPETALNAALLDKAAQFQASLRPAAAFSEIRRACAVVGHGHQTITAIETREGQNAPTPIRRDAGDGTVPLLSATMAGAIPSSRLFPVREKHAALPSNPAVIDFILAKTEDWRRPALHS